MLTFDFRVQDHWTTECMVAKKLVYTCLTHRSDTSRHQASICARWTVDTSVEETCICLLLNIIYNDCLSLVYIYTMIHIKFYRLKFHGDVSVMASTKHYVVLAMLKAAGCCGSQ